MSQSIYLYLLFIDCKIDPPHILNYVQQTYFMGSMIISPSFWAVRNQMSAFKKNTFILTHFLHIQIKYHLAWFYGIGITLISAYPGITCPTSISRQDSCWSLTYEHFWGLLKGLEVQDTAVLKETDFTSISVQIQVWLWVWSSLLLDDLNKERQEECSLTTFVRSFDDFYFQLLCYPTELLLQFTQNLMKKYVL